MSSELEYFYPIDTSDGVTKEQAFLNQILVPKISNNGHELSQFFKTEEVVVDAEKQRSKKANDKIVCLNGEYECDFENYLRNSKIKDRKDHVEFMQQIKPHELAALSPYARFYVVDAKNLKKSNFKQSSIPISFGKGFDLDFFLKNTKSSSRGEGAGIVSIQANRVYNITGDYDPITLNAQFFFSSYEVLVNKLAVEKEHLAGFSYGGNNQLARSFSSSGFANKVQDLRYTELLKRSDDFKLVLEYGWNYTPGIASDILSPKQKELIDKYEKVYYKISPITHTINFNEDGSFTLNVTYVPAPLRDLEIKPGVKDTIFDLIIEQKNFSIDEKNVSDIRKKIKDLKDNIKKVNKDLKLTPNDQTLKDELNTYNAKLKEYEAALKRALVDKTPVITKYIIDEFHKINLFNSYKLLIKEENDTITSNLTLKVGEKRGLGEIEKKITSSTTKASIKKKTYELIKKRYKNFDPELYAKEDESNATVDSVIKNLLDPKNNNKEETSEETSFIFFKDILRGMYYLSEKYDKDNQILFEVPYYILGNIAYPLPSGDKYWCNVGDLAFTEKNFKQSLIDFFKSYPNGNFKKFVNFFVQKIIPTYVVNKSNIAAFPSLATPFYHFEQETFRKDYDGLGEEKFTKLFQGDKKVFHDFCAKYFNSASEKASTGCFFIGQSSNVLYENSNIFLSKTINAFEQSFFKRDSELLKLGIGKLVIGSSNGLLKRLSFSSNSDDTITNLSHVLNEKKPAVAGDIISSNFQYTISAEMFGNRVYEFSNLIYVPSYTLGKNVSAPANLNNLSRQQLQSGVQELDRARDFEIGGLYTINSVTDNLQLTNGTYTKSINAVTVLRESKIVQDRMRQLSKEGGNRVLFPGTKFNETLSGYIDRNYTVITINNAKNNVESNK